MVTLGLYLGESDGLGSGGFQRRGEFQFVLGGVNDLRVSDGVEAVIDLRIPDGEVLNVYLFGDAATWHDGVTHL